MRFWILVNASGNQDSEYLSEAREFYERVLGTYPGETALVAKAKTRLNAPPFKIAAEGRIQVTTPFTNDVTSFALSPEGRDVNSRGCKPTGPAGKEISNPGGVEQHCGHVVRPFQGRENHLRWFPWVLPTAIHVEPLRG